MGENVVDKLFGRGRYDYLHTMDNLAQETKTITDLESVVESTLSTIISSLHCRNASILLRSRPEGLYHRATQGLIWDEELKLKREGVLAWWMENHRDFLPARYRDETAIQSAHCRGKGMLERLKVDFLAPLVT